MARYRKPPTVQLDHDSQVLVAALTESFLWAGRNAPPVNEEARAAADQYREIRAALRTHAEPIPKAAAHGTDTSTTSDMTYTK